MDNATDYQWKDRDDDVEGRLTKAPSHPSIIAVVQLSSTPNTQFPKDRGAIGIEIDRDQAVAIIEWLMNTLKEHALEIGSEI
jgi:coproporphyrinogen III oxidase-like Fe-S oxidoreductase